MQNVHMYSPAPLEAEQDVIIVKDRLDSATVEGLEQDARNFMLCGTQNLVLDCSRLNNLTAAGMHAILAIAKDMQKRSGTLSVRHLEGQARAMFEACGFDQIISTGARAETDADRLAA